MNNELSIIDLVINASLVVQLVMFILMLMSVYSWTIIFAKRKLVIQSRSDIRQFSDAFYQNANLDDTYQAAQMVEADQRSIIQQICVEGVDEFTKVVGNLQQDEQTPINRAYQKMQVVMNRELDKVAHNLPSLAMIGSISPFVGLFGTVWGIMHSFIGLATVKQATIAVVAPGIAEALIATALGLFVAIPATMAYNSFMARMDDIYAQHQIIADELHIMIQQR